MIKVLFKQDKAMEIMKDWIFQNQFIPDIINRKVLGQVGHAVKSSQNLNGILHDRPSYKKLTGQALGFKKRMFSSKLGLGGQEGMLYNVSAKKNKVSIYLVRDDLYTRKQAQEFKTTEMKRILNVSKGRWQSAATNAINETWEKIGWK